MCGGRNPRGESRVGTPKIEARRRIAQRIEQSSSCTSRASPRIQRYGCARHQLSPTIGLALHRQLQHALIPLTQLLGRHALATYCSSDGLIRWARITRAHSAGLPRNPCGASESAAQTAYTNFRCATCRSQPQRFRRANRVVLWTSASAAFASPTHAKDE